MIGAREGTGRIETPTISLVTSARAAAQLQAAGRRQTNPDGRLVSIDRVSAGTVDDRSVATDLTDIRGEAPGSVIR